MRIRTGLTRISETNRYGLIVVITQPGRELRVLDSVSGRKEIDCR